MWRPSGIMDMNYKEDEAIVRTRLQKGLLIASLVAVYLLPLWVGGRLLNFINLITITAISVQGVNILTGLTGQITLGQTAFMAVGAYCVALTTVYWHLSFWLALPLAMFITGLVGLLFGIPSLRIKGFYLAMATLAAQFIIPWFIINIRPDLTFGYDTLPVPSPLIGGFALKSQTSLFYLCMTLGIFGTFFARNLQRSRFGRAFVAVRDNDLAAEIMGIGIFRYKLLAFFICSLYAGLAGGLYAVWMRGVSPDHFTLSESIWLLGMLIVGGLGHPAGVWFGVIFIRTLDLSVRYLGPYVQPFFDADVGTAVAKGMGPAVFGIIGLVFLIFEPRGLYRIWERFKAFYRIWPFSY